MTEIKHAAEVVVPDDPDFPVGSDEWNAAHTVDIDAADVSVEALTHLEGDDVQEVLGNVDTAVQTGVDHIAQATSAHNASAIQFDDPGDTYSSDDVESALQEVFDHFQVITPQNLGDLNDVSLGTVTPGESLVHNGDAWEALSPTAAFTTIADAGNNYTATNVETALAEIHDLVESIQALAFLVTTSTALLDNEVAVGATPGGELGGTWASPTVDTTHSGSSHAGAVTYENLDANGDVGTSSGQVAIGNHTHAGGGVTDADYLVGTAHAGLSAEIVVGTTPGGELGGTWASPTVDATHSGSAHLVFDDAGAPAAVSTAAADGTSDNPSRKDHVHAHEAAHIAHDTIWDAANDYVRGSGADTGTRQAASAATPAAISTSGSTGTAANPPSADDHVHAHEAAHLAHDTLWAAAGDLVKGTGNDTADILSRGSDDQFLRSTGSTIAWESPPFSVSITLIGAAPANGNYMVWRAPFPCTLTNVRSHFKGGTNAVVNARRNQTSNGLSSNFTNSTADAWGDGGSVQNTAYAAGDDLELMLVSTSGAVTEVCIQADFTRP